MLSLWRGSGAREDRVPRLHSERIGDLMRYFILGLILSTPLHAQTVPAFTDPDRAEKVAATAATVDQKFRE